MDEIRWIPRDRNRARFDGVMILAMAARLPDLIPAITFDGADHLPDFHRTSLSTDFDFNPLGFTP